MKKMVDGVLMDMDDEDIAAQEAVMTEIARERPEIERKHRDSLLAATDWWVTKSIETGVALTDDQVGYRQALRDVPTQDGFPNNITWPQNPLEPIAEPAAEPEAPAEPA